MHETPTTLTYIFRCDDEARREIRFDIVFDGDLLDRAHHAPNPPQWTRLDYEQCPVCPLSADEHERCPAALSIVELVDECGDLLSYTEVDATVITPEREYHKRTTVQKALSSLIGLRMAVSGCPVLGKFRPMARFHLPFATRSETLFRAASAYLLAQYYMKKRQRQVDMDLRGLHTLYDDVHRVNLKLAARLRSLSNGDANVNALVLLDLFTQDVPFSIENYLDSLEPFFSEFL